MKVGTLVRVTGPLSFGKKELIGRICDDSVYHAGDVRDADGDYWVKDKYGLRWCCGGCTFEELPE